MTCRTITNRPETYLLVFMLFFIDMSVMSQNTVTSSGNWDNTSIWDGGDIGDDISEDVDFDNSLGGDVVVRDGYTYTIGDLDIGKDNTLRVDEGGTLNVGSSGTGNERDVNANYGGTIIVYGDMTIYGDLNMAKDLTIIVTGTLTIVGDLNGAAGASLTVDGEMYVTNIYVGSGSTIDGTGTIYLSGECEDGNSDFCGEGPLPVELLYFEGSYAYPYAYLNWATASETNNDFFKIERSFDGMGFSKAGIVAGSGTTKETTNYQFKDPVTRPGTVYYRLSQTDLDGTVENLKIISVQASPGTGTRLQVFPNPVEGIPFKVLVVGADVRKPVRISIINASGTEVYSADYQSDLSGVISLNDVSLVSLQKGIYILKVRQKGLSLSKKFILQ